MDTIRQRQENSKLMKLYKFRNGLRKRFFEILPWAKLFILLKLITIISSSWMFISDMKDLTFGLCITDIGVSRVIKEITNLEFASENNLAWFCSDTLELKCCVGELHLVRWLEIGWIYSTDDAIWTLIGDNREFLISCCLCNGAVFHGESKSLNKRYSKIDDSLTTTCNVV